MERTLEVGKHNKLLLKEGITPQTMLATNIISILHNTFHYIAFTFYIIYIKSLRYFLEKEFSSRHKILASIIKFIVESK